MPNHIISIKQVKNILTVLLLNSFYFNQFIKKNSFLKEKISFHSKSTCMYNMTFCATSFDEIIAML